MSDDTPKFETAFEPAHGQAIMVADNVQRITVRNPGPFTFHGTNSYIVGKDSVCVIDPGPDNDEHFDALMRALAGREVTHIAVSHTHKDHSPLSRRLKAATGGLIVGEGPHRPARPLFAGETNPFAESSDSEFAPDIVLSDDVVLEGDGWALRGIATPGHTANHMAFALEDTDILFSADHVMAWATTIVAPPDGAMSDYMASLDRLMGRSDRLYLPGHGGPVNDPQPFLRGLKTHRRMRESAILKRLAAGDRTIANMVKVIYRDTDPRLHGAASLSVLAHLEDLVTRGAVRCEGVPRLSAEYEIA
ncbi:MBL fold metallo-hydrolase [Rhizobium sp. L1K21]|uniref:MBL fold metallo-hydrolase n=1 Tax=Rhizobium sp. L1K21 TaxID=2954933 RepID=UPI002093C4C2|nr:MBL fold metallo-hydrolase [Rhizobium sp. L1K21]MCO6186957.1 MBL fold metallo-hydrolase [Rhizobium sp. L1K21]